MHKEKEKFFEQLVIENYTPLVRYALHILRDPYLAEDLVMDTLYTSWLKIDELQGHQNPAGWLRTTLRHKIGNHLSLTSSRAQHLISMDQDELQSQKFPGPGVGDDEHILLLSMEQALDPEDHAFLMSRYRDGLQYSQLAQLHDCSVWSCQKRMQRIREALRKKFPEYSKK